MYDQKQKVLKYYCIEVLIWVCLLLMLLLRLLLTTQLPMLWHKCAIQTAPWAM